MVNIIFCGCFGRMGNAVRRIVKESCTQDEKNTQELKIVAGVDICEEDAEFPVYKVISDVKESADVIIDFSSPKALDSILEYSVSKNVPVVLCTTGYSEEQLAQIKEASEKVAILRSANMSLGINTLAKLIQTAAQILADNGYDIEIVERHHNQKKDAPSGTALLLADAINAACDGRYEYVYDRSDRSMARPKNEIGISAVRGGSIVGDHEVIFAGLDEVVEIKHTAYSRNVFAKGAVSAATFLAGKPAGLYTMSDVIG
ncbi:MAG: 4-hydroxy-tetrahydrodipicolinate reductase [Lachnospiraceae bacterium]|nr:4-hydroxy-tetrahydrodipicolinate reductase [Lachnospiraceae bacterium]